MPTTYLGPRPAYDGDGKQIREVLVVNTADGTAPHLAWSSSGAEKTFCGLIPHRVSSTWFEAIGCSKCAKSARMKGILRITDVDGELIDL